MANDFTITRSGVCVRGFMVEIQTNAVCFFMGQVARYRTLETVYRKPFSAVKSALVTITLWFCCHRQRKWRFEKPNEKKNGSISSVCIAVTSPHTRKMCAFITNSIESIHKVYSNYINAMPLLLEQLTQKTHRSTEYGYLPSVHFGPLKMKGDRRTAGQRWFAPHKAQMTFSSDFT